MVEFYFFTIIVVYVAFISEKISSFILIIGVGFFLLTFPDNGLDYSKYEATFYTGAIIDDFPFFQSERLIDSEPFYLWYSAFMSVLLFKQFPLFLCVNFLLSVGLSFIAFKILPRRYFHLFWLFLLPVIIPTLFYFSPRSSISFILVVFGFMSLVKRKLIPCLIAILIAILFHSQFILVSVLMIGTYILISYRMDFHIKRSKRIIIIISIVISVLLFFVSNFIGLISSVLLFLPSADIAIAKLSYFENAREGYRLTSILSVIIYPLISFFILRNFENGHIKITNNIVLDKTLLIMLFAVICYGAAINIAFFGAPHLAGRLSRVPDYMGIGLVLPIYFLSLKNKFYLFAALLIFVISAPLAFPTLYYNVNWGF
jgi:hypothetical protein